MKAFPQKFIGLNPWKFSPANLSMLEHILATQISIQLSLRRYVGMYWHNTAKVFSTYEKPDLLDSVIEQWWQ